MFWDQGRYPPAATCRGQAARLPSKENAGKKKLHIYG